MLRPSWFAWGLIGVCMLVLIWRFPLRHVFGTPALPVDFNVYATAWERITLGLNPYVVSDPSPYKYSPGVLALMKLLPAERVAGWIAFASVSIVGFALGLAAGAKYRTWREVGALALGLVLAWKGILETLDYGQLELLLLAIAVASAATIARLPFLSGLLAGILPWFKLPWLLLALPLVIFAARGVPKPPGLIRKPIRIRMFVSGYFLSWFIWGAALPSMAFGPERAKFLSQSWIAILRVQPHDLYFSDMNQSIWVSALRWGAQGGSANRWFVLGLAALLAGGLLFVLARRLTTVLRVTSGRKLEVFAWMAPWLLLTQLVNPLSWRWGSALLVGLPFATKESQVTRPRMRALLWGCVVLLWLLQLNPVVKMLGFDHWSALHGSGLVTAYWLALLVLCL